MKKIILFLLLVPFFATATINQNLAYGLKQNSGVKELQQFLIKKGFLATGSDSGNFFSMTLSSVKKYQTSKKISATGYVGSLTRQSINSDNLLPTTTALPTTTTTTTIATKPASSSLPLTGTLDLVQSSYPSQTVTIPQNNLKIAEFTLTNNTSEPINLKTVEVDISIDSNVYSINPSLSSLYVMCGDSKTSISSVPADKNYLTVLNNQILVGKSINLSVYVNISTSILPESTIHTGMIVSGISGFSVSSLHSNLNTVLNGQSVNFGTASLEVSRDSSTPTNMSVSSNQKIIAGKFELKAMKDSYVLTSVKFIIPTKHASSVVKNAVLFDGANEVMASPRALNPSSSDSNYILDFATNLPIPLNTTKSFTLYYNLYNDVSSNVNVSPVLAYIKAKNGIGIPVDAVASGYELNAFSGGISMPSDGITFNKILVFKSIPTITVATSGTSLVDPLFNLYNFSISANPSGDVYIKQLLFVVATADTHQKIPYLSNFTFTKGNSNYSSSVSIGNLYNGNITSVTAGNGGFFGESRIIVVSFTIPEKIAAGKTETYRLNTHISNLGLNSTPGSSSITTSIPGDMVSLSGGNYLESIIGHTYFGLSQFQNDPQPVPYNLLWSDNSNNSDMKNWYNGYNILNLPLSPQTITTQ